MPESLMNVERVERRWGGLKRRRGRARPRRQSALLAAPRGPDTTEREREAQGPCAWTPVFLLGQGDGVQK